MSKERYVISSGCILLFSAFIVSSISGDMNLYDILVIAATLTEKGILTNNLQKLIVILSLFGGILTIFGGLSYLFQVRTNRSVLQIDKAQFANFKEIIKNQGLMEDMIKHFMRKSGGMQQELMEKIERLEKRVKEIGEAVREDE